MTMTNEQRIKLALIRLRHISETRELLNGHFSKVAKEYGVKVKELKKAHQEATK